VVWDGKGNGSVGERPVFGCGMGISD